MFELTLNFGGTVLKGKGNTVLEALESIEKPVKVLQKTILTLTKGDKTFTRPLTVPQARRLFQPLAQQIISKQLELCLR